jgi:predicted RNase H-like HicB family nuclease
MKSVKRKKTPVHGEKIFDVIIHEVEEGGYWAECPVLRGCNVQGETLEEVERNMKEAIELCIEEINNKNDIIPVQKRIYILPIAI